MVGGVGFDPGLVVGGAPAQDLLADRRNTDHVAEEVHHLRRPRQAAEVTVNDNAVKAVVDGVSPRHAALPGQHMIFFAHPLFGPLAYGVYFIFKSMEQGATFRVSCNSLKIPWQCPQDPPGVAKPSDVDPASRSLCER